MKPIIGITVECEHRPEDPRTRGELHVHWNYAQAVADHGGVPILIPPTADVETVAKILDGWLIPGGPDIDASRWGEANHPKVEVQDPARYEVEAALYEAIPKEMPILGICYGCQFLNVVRGGSLIQHLPDVVGHEEHSSGQVFSYSVAPNSKIRAATGQPAMEGKSYHHQAIERLGNGLEITAHAEDGTVEALEATDRPWVVGVQWHPERTLENPATESLLRTFVEQCRRFASQKCR